MKQTAIHRATDIKPLLILLYVSNMLILRQQISYSMSSTIFCRFIQAFTSKYALNIVTNHEVAIKTVAVIMAVL